MKRQIGKIAYITFLALLMLAALGLWGFHIVMYWQTTERNTKVKRTTVEEVRSVSHLKITLSLNPFLRKTLRHYKHEDDYGMTLIPGLNKTRTMRAGTDDVCTNMVPQSVCVTDQYMLIGAYCKTKTHYSVIYVLDINTRDYIKTIVLPGRHHVGGISWDRVHDTIWVSGYGKRAQANCILLDTIKKYNYDVYHRPIRFYEENDLYSIPKNSFLACYNGYLYVGYFQVDDNSVLQKFKINEKNGKLVKVSSDRYTMQYGVKLPSDIVVPVNVALISSKVQGLTFSEYRMYVTESYGITRSKLAVFSILDDDEENQDYRNENAISIINLPQKLEQVTVEAKEIYSVYESAAYAYRFYSFPVIDRVIKMKISDVKKYGNDEYEEKEERKDTEITTTQDIFPKMWTQ